MSIAVFHSIMAILWCLTAFLPDDCEYIRGFFCGTVFAIALTRVGLVI